MICGDKKLKRKRTSTKKTTTTPVYNEGITFSVPKNFTLADMVVEIEVVHDGGHHFGPTGRNTVLGVLTLPLVKYVDLWKAVINGDNSKARWYPLEKP